MRSLNSLQVIDQPIDVVAKLLGDLFSHRADLVDQCIADTRIAVLFRPRRIWN